MEELLKFVLCKNDKRPLTNWGTTSLYRLNYSENINYCWYHKSETINQE